MGNKVKGAAADAYNRDEPTYNIIIVGDPSASSQLLGLPYSTDISEHNIRIETPSLKRELPQAVNLSICKCAVLASDRYRTVRFH